MKRLMAGLVVGLLVGSTWVVAADAPAKAPGKVFTIGMSQCNLGEPWRVQMNADIKKAAEAHPDL